MPLHEQLYGPGLAFLGERQRTLQLWNASLKQLYSKLFWFSEIRKSHKNPVVNKIYEEFLDVPGSYRAEKLLHTKYNEIEG